MLSDAHCSTFSHLPYRLCLTTTEYPAFSAIAFCLTRILTALRCQSDRQRPGTTRRYSGGFAVLHCRLLHRWSCTSLCLQSSKPAKCAGSSCAGGLDAAACVRRMGVLALGCHYTRGRDGSRPPNTPPAFSYSRTLKTRGCLTFYSVVLVFV